jgi:CO dehydrogenase maturation factor
MRIVFLGKGGSGKTTTTAAFIKHLAKKQKHILAIDADVNAHLQSALNIEGEPKYIGENFQAIAEYVSGDREIDTEFIGTTPPDLKSKFIEPKESDEFVKKFSLRKNNISLLTVGTYKKEDVGTTCYHGKLMGLESLFHHLIDGPKDWVVTDATAGVDIGTSLFLAYDLNVFVVEPTLKSVNVFKDFLSFSEQFGLNTKCIINKFDPEDEQFIKEHIPAKYILGKLPSSKHIKRFEQGVIDAFDDYINECFDTFTNIENKAAQLAERDWDSYLENLKKLHRKNSRAWYNDYYSQNLENQIDEEFTYNLISK